MFVVVGALQMKLKSEHEDIFSHSFPIPNYNEPALALWFSLEQLQAKGLYDGLKTGDLTHWFSSVPNHLRPERVGVYKKIRFELVDHGKVLASYIREVA